MSSRSKEPIAIVGISLEIPSGQHSANNLDHQGFFQFLLDKKESYETFPSSRYNTKGYVGEGLGRVISDTGSFLKRIDEFDPVEFGVSAKDALSMSLSTRKLLEHTFLALRDSGVDYRGKDVGFYGAGVSFNLEGFTDSGRTEFDASGSFAGSPSMIANKVSYHLDLRGPSVPVDTACSSSITATHLAVQAIRTGDCEAAIVGGAQLNHRFIDFIHYSQGHVLSPDGKCKPFDANANGFSRGEGVGAIVLKPLKQAILDQDKIYGTILGTGLTSAGNVGPVYAPVASAQEAAMDRAYRGTGYTPLDVDFIELHATGTAAGDPTEVNWVGRKLQRENGLLVGSVKGNIGHLEIASFLASLSKVCSILEHKIIPPTVNVSIPNPAIHWEEFGLRVPTTSTKLPLSDARKPLISISNYGIGGVNGHALVEAPPMAIPRLKPDNENLPTETVIVCGGLTPRSATAVADGLVQMLQSPSFRGSVGDVAFASARQARSMTWRTFFTLDHDLRCTTSPRQPQLVPRNRVPCIFVFSGQGPQHVRMGRQLFQTQKLFRDSILEMDLIYKTCTGKSMVTDIGLFGTPIQSCMVSDAFQWPISLTLPANAMIQMALYDLLCGAGVIPDAIVGHSAGETAMLYAAGCASKAFVLELAIARGKAMSLMETHNLSMAAITCGEGQCEEMLEELRREKPGFAVDLACQNAPEAVAVSGDADDLELLVLKAKLLGFSATKLRTTVSVHSEKMAICEGLYRELVDEVFSRHGPLPTPSIPTWSTFFGRRMTEPFTSKYFWDSARGVVLFESAIRDALSLHPGATFVELSPHPVLASYISMMSVAPSSIVGTMYRPSRTQQVSEAYTYLSALGSLSVNGVAVNWDAVNALRKGDLAKVQLPAYPFAKTSIPYLPQNMITDCKTRFGPLNFPHLHVNASTHPELVQHVINKEPIMPASGFLEMIFETGAKVIRDVEYTGMLPLLQDGILKVDVTIDSNQQWTIKSKNPALQAEPRIHARGRIDKTLEVTQAMLDVVAIKARCKALDVSNFYVTLANFAEYGPLFQRVQGCYVGRREALSIVSGIPKAEKFFSISRYIWHPAVLDAAFHILIHPDFTCIPPGNDYYLPSKLSQLLVHPAWNPESPPDTMLTHVTFKEWRPDAIVCDLKISDLDGNLLVSIDRFEAARHEMVMMSKLPLASYDITFEPTDIYIDLGSRSTLPPGSRSIKFSSDAIFDIQTILATTDVDTLWIHAVDNIEGAASCGFSRALKRESLRCKIHLVLFDQRVPSDIQEGVIGVLASRSDVEDEVRVNTNGRLYVPRIMPVVVPDELAPPMRDLLSKGCTLRSDKTYLLVGGLGSLGLRVSVWMYERGARTIVLTSKSGRASLTRRGSDADSRVLEYLEALPDLNLYLHACDATSVADTSALLTSLPLPVAGCLLMTVVLSDRLFLAHTRESFEASFPAKITAFSVLETCLSISSLDFFVAFSSASTFGNTGQTNYASANSQMDAMACQYPNTFSLISPAIRDTHTFTDAVDERYIHWMSWALSAREVCQALEDGITKLQAGIQFTLHIPPLKWNEMATAMGPDPMWNHLVQVKKESEDASIEDSLKHMSEIIQKVVDISGERLDPRVPLTSYGLDSLSAGRLSYMLQPLLHVTQLQLLADLSLDDLNTRLLKTMLTDG